ncbi:hypothetical protein AB0E01_44200 [Nocardia vinacea]|uniref:hypothetical protein n=1 Tax=Nocardia vinacea TaxID=96468 RepID=UPI0033C379EC
MFNMKPKIRRRISTLVAAAAVSGGLVAMASSASADNNCGNEYLAACITATGTEIVGNGHASGELGNARWWIAICRADHDQGATDPCYGNHEGWEVRVPIQTLPHGSYVTKFYIGNDSKGISIFSSPISV